MSERSVVEAMFEDAVIRAAAAIMGTMRPTGRKSLEFFVEAYEDPKVRDVRLTLSKSQGKTPAGRLAICESSFEMRSLDLV